MAEVENKVVSISFDNASFQRKMSETIASLDKLRQSIDMASAKQGLTSLGDAANKFSMEPMGSQVDGISARFAAMATVGITALVNLTNRVVDAGIQFAKSMAVEPITQGFGEFELKMGSIQTIMAGSGESLDVVNKKLAELNAYSDKTIYSFGDMTSNIGKFTNAGVKLDDAVGAIQGVANVAALSGANAEEASRAMYNFGQALGQGSVKAIDWKSIELANMGTVEFKQQLIDTAVAMGTLTKAGDGTYKTLKGTTVTTGNFATTLQDAWLTSEALTGTLNKFSDTNTDIGKRATEAATKVKTFSQMLDTMKESVGSGWATTFETIIGNFDEGSELFTRINNAFGNIVGTSAQARNDMLAHWKKLGGRDLLIQGFTDALKGLGTIIKPIKEAFREIFPKKTGTDLFQMTKRFADFARTIKIGADTAASLKNGFKTFFAILSIGWAVIKGVVSVIFTLVKGFAQLLGPILALGAGNSTFVHSLQEMLVKEGGIKKFFDTINTFILKPFEAITKLTAAVINFFKSFSLSGAAKKGAEEAGESMEKTAGFAERLFNALKNVFQQIGEFFGGLGKAIGKAMQGIGGAISDALGSGDFGQVLDVLKVGLLGGILVYIRKFFKNGLKIDFGQKAFFDRIGDKFSEMMDSVTGTLKSLQANVRADTLMKIAIALGILVVSIIALSLVDGDALKKAMAAVAVGFAQLTAVMFALEKMSSGGLSSSVKIAAMGATLIALAAAIAILAVAVKIFSTMDGGELAKGLAGAAVGMIAMAGAVRLIGSDTKGIFRASAAMILISVALIVLAKAIKSFAEMNLTEMAWGLAQAAIGIGLLIFALKRMPDDVATKGLGLLILAFALRSLARVVQLFAGISFPVLAKGFIAIAAGLYLIGKAFSEMPDDMLSKSVAMIALSASLWIMAIAIQKVGNIPFGELLKGIGGLTVMLVVLAAAIVAMDEAKGGVGGLLAAAVGLLIIGAAIKQVGGIPFGDLIKGILGLALVLAVLAAASLVAPEIALLGVALMLVGAAFIMFGVGIAAAGKGFELMAKYGTKAMGYLGAALKEFIRQLPSFVTAFVQGIIDAGIELGKRFPEMIDTVEAILVGLLDALLNILPKLREVFRELIGAGFEILMGMQPQLVEFGIGWIMSLLRGIRDNIGEFVHVVGEIVTNFIDAFGEEVPRIIESIAGFFENIARGLGELIPTFMPGLAAAFIDGFLSGIGTMFPGVEQFFRDIIDSIIGFFTSGFGIFSPSTVMADIGKNIIQGLINGIKSLGGILKKLFIDIPLNALKWIGNVARTLWDKGVNFIGGLIGGIKNKIVEVKDFYLGLGKKVLGWIGDVGSTLAQKGRNFISGLYNGITEKIVLIKNWFTGLAGKVIGWVGNAGEMLIGVGKDLIRGLWGGINKMKDWVMDKVKGFAGNVVDGIKGFFGIGSPSKVFMAIGGFLGEGLGIGIRNMSAYAANSATTLGDNVKKGWERAKVALAAHVSEMDELNPTISPVLDLERVRAEAKNLDKYMNVSAIRPEVSIDRANAIAVSASNQNGSDSGEPVKVEEHNHYNQTINSPTPLSASDIYKSTKSLLAVTKDELEVA